MSTLHASISFRILLVSLFLWAQSAVALHDAEHDHHDPSELCEVLASADNAKAVISQSSSIEQNYSYSTEYLTLGASLTHRFVITRSARSPPHITSPYVFLDFISS